MCVYVCVYNVSNIYYEPRGGGLFDFFWYGCAAGFSATPPCPTEELGKKTPCATDQGLHTYPVLRIREPEKTQI